ncbi:MAG: helix-turn-helix transcriptional regulator [Betaproteobacteria bacterium]
MAAFCAMRQGGHAEALRELDAAVRENAPPGNDAGTAMRIDTWRAELAYFQGRYSQADDIVDRLIVRLEESGDLAYAAFALRIRIAILLARVDYDGISAIAERAIRIARASGDRYVMVQVFNILGAAHFDRATSKLDAPHARMHLTSIDPRDAAPMETDAREALRLFENARDVAISAHYEYAAWYVAGNIERLQILLGHADHAVRAIRKRLGVLQSHGARYDEIVTRSNLAWGLRTLGRYPEALHELDVAQHMARETGTFNVLLEFLEYDRSVVLDALGDTAAARASYRRYLHLAAPQNGHARSSPGSVRSGAATRPLEPAFLKRADWYAKERLGEAFTMAELAAHCGVSLRTLEKSFTDFRGITPVAHVRNLRLDHALQALVEGACSVAEVASRCGFGSPTTFAIEFRKRFGVSPRQRKRARSCPVSPTPEQQQPLGPAHG